MVSLGAFPSLLPETIRYVVANGELNRCFESVHWQYYRMEPHADIHRFNWHLLGHAASREFLDPRVGN